MNIEDAKVGQRVQALVSFAGVPAGTQGVIDGEYDGGVMVAWDRPGHPLPAGYRVYDGVPCVNSGILRDGFDKEKELQYLGLGVAPPFTVETLKQVQVRLRQEEFVAQVARKAFFRNCYNRHGQLVGPFGMRVMDG